MWDEQQLREALREEINGPAPAARTELSDIMPRGLRRRRFRQAGSVAAAVAVVAGIGVVAMTFGGKNAHVNEPAKTSEMPPVLHQPAGWSRADMPAESPISTWTPRADAPPLPDVPPTGLPRCSPTMMPGDPDPVPIQMPGATAGRLMAVLRKVAAPATVGELKARANAADSPEYTVDITDGNGTGSIRIWPELSPVEPLITANAEAFNENNCQPPKRIVKPDGSIAQIYQIRPTYDERTHAFGDVTQALSVYLPDRTTYRIHVQSWGEKDVAADTSVKIKMGPGRKSLPLTEYQLSELGEGLTGG
ncbi:hypothetical protein DMH04_46360 [Kibdelosporangium aridum]|uniref:Uncharacterized protein n=1 Tax=Kibdelosporangium aridum TaxID=2030 RepID=A0A428YMA7_KIBAR|nr:hypothetical protein [Kibdelosporangium aridum]RSM69034.1 hypothetical protein DMH04_46360 [Kibdelosporangium aridum]